MDFLPVGGLDEAGRGPVIGPMVIGLVIMDPREIKKYPVADSKALTPMQREKIFSMLPREAIRWEIIDVPEINNAMSRGVSLNEIEAMHMGKLIEESNAVIYYIDCVGRYPQNFKKRLTRYTSKRVVPLIRGDKRVPIISAASIVAKVIRDRLVAKIRELIGDFGSGYPSDPKTQEFLIKNKDRLHKLTAYVRIHWATVQKLFHQTRLDDYAFSKN